MEDTEDGSIQAYWREVYISAFTSILEDLKDRLDSPFIEVFVKIENTLMNAICAPDILLDTSIMDEQYWNESQVLHAPLKGMTVLKFKEELGYLHQ